MSLGGFSLILRGNSYRRLGFGGGERHVIGPDEAEERFQERHPIMLQQAGCLAIGLLRLFITRKNHFVRGFAITAYAFQCFFPWATDSSLRPQPAKLREHLGNDTRPIMLLAKPKSIISCRDPREMGLQILQPKVQPVDRWREETTAPMDVCAVVVVLQQPTSEIRVVARLL